MLVGTNFYSQARFVRIGLTVFFGGLVYYGSGLCLLWFFFFFQAEDGIRDADVTGVQTCALPILTELAYGWLDHRGSPYTEAMKLTERFRRPNYGLLEIELTVDDPMAYTKPFSVRVLQRAVVDGSELIEFICHENQTFLKNTGREPRTDPAQR